MNAPAIDTIVFDFGGVVVDWNMRHLFDRVFDGRDDLDHFLTEVLTPAENLRCDLGAPLASVTAELSERHPEYGFALDAWRDRWIETVPDVIDGTLDLLDDLAAADYLLLGCSNFSAETFPLCARRHQVFHRFADIALSGDLGVAKPDPRIFETLLSRNDVSPAQAVFVDDSSTNVEGAVAFGMRGVRFTSAEQTRAELIDLGVRID